MGELINIDYFLRDSRKFPWNILSTGVPKVGPVHTYLCTMLADFAPEGYREFMKHLPSMRELRRAAGVEPESIMIEIFKYCEQCYNMPASQRPNVAQEVLGFLSSHKGYRKYVQTTLDTKYRAGLISVPKGAL
jgi:hypothetical protein